MARGNTFKHEPRADANWQVKRYVQLISILFISSFMLLCLRSYDQRDDDWQGGLTEAWQQFSVLSFHKSSPEYQIRQRMLPTVGSGALGSTASLSPWITVVVGCNCSVWSALEGEAMNVPFPPPYRLGDYSPAAKPGDNQNFLSLAVRGLIERLSDFVGLYLWLQIIRLSCHSAP